MKSYELMGLTSKPKNIIQNLCLQQEARASLKANSEEDEERSIFANSPIVLNADIGKKSAKSNGSCNSAHLTPVSGDKSGPSGETSKQQTFESMMRSGGH
jgi:hypothetical protein